MGDENLSRSVLRDLVARSRRMPQVTSGSWQVQYAVFVRDDASPATYALADEIGTRVVTLAEMEAALIQAASQEPARGSQLSDQLRF